MVAIIMKVVIRGSPIHDLSSLSHTVKLTHTHIIILISGAKRVNLPEAP